MSFDKNNETFSALASADKWYSTFNQPHMDKAAKNNYIHLFLCRFIIIHFICSE